MSIEMEPFYRSHTSFYCRSIATIVLSCTISEITRYIGRNFRTMWLPEGEQFEIMFNTIHGRDVRTDGHRTTA